MPLYINQVSPRTARRLTWLPCSIVVLFCVVTLSGAATEDFDSFFKKRTTQDAPTTWQVHFSPGGGCTDAVVAELNNAKVSVLVQAYSFTSAPIAKALVEAFRRGVKVQAILDRSNATANYSAADLLVYARIPTFIDNKHAIAHNKVMVIDGDVVITGSFNFTKAAEESNAENLLVITDRNLAARYTENWLTHRSHSGVFANRKVSN